MKKEKLRKSLGNEGFTLVELIIVIAIIAILVGILAPQYIKYVEKSRIAADQSTLDSFMSSVQVAVADPDCSWEGGNITTSVEESTGKITFIYTDVNGTGGTKLEDEVTTSIGSNDVVLKSKTGKKLGTNLKLTIADNGTCTWSGYPTSWTTNPAASPSPTV